MISIYDTDSSKSFNVYNSKELQDAVANTFQYYEDYIERLRNENRRLKENAKEIVENGYKQQIANLEQRLLYSYGEFASQKELDAYENFVNKHMHNRMESVAEGGKAPYIIPTYTGFGCVKKVVCQICGKSEDITDTEVW